MFARAFALKRPWGLLDASQRIELRADENVLEPVCGLQIVAPDDLRVRFSGRRVMAAEPEGGVFEWNGRKQLWTIPLGSKQSESIFKLVFNRGDEVGEDIPIQLVGPLARPREPNTEDPAGRLLKLLMSLVERVRTLLDGESDEIEYHATGRKIVSASVPWRHASDNWCREMLGDSEPPLDIIVRHAESLHRIVDELAERPRRVLKRVRERLPIDRLQEMDSACLDWYVRQPGRNVEEKAGSRQSLLGISRQENFATLENRILAAYLQLAAAAASNYTALHRSLISNERVSLVSRFGRRCRLLERELLALDVTPPLPPVTPNYVLQHDQRYRKVWSGYLELLRRKEEEDDIWRWQIRLWAEFVRLSLLIALRNMPGAQVIAETPLSIRTDQRRGRWVDISPHPLVLVLPIEHQKVVVTVIDAQDPRSAEYGSVELWRHFWSVGVICVLHAEDLDTREETWVLVWAVHPIDGKAINLKSEVNSVDHAVGELKLWIQKLGGGLHRLRGVALVSDSTLEINCGRAEKGDSIACSCPVNANNLKETLAYLTREIPYIIGA